MKAKKHCRHSSHTQSHKLLRLWTCFSVRSANGKLLWEQLNTTRYWMGFLRRYFLMFLLCAKKRAKSAIMQCTVHTVTYSGCLVVERKSQCRTEEMKRKEWRANKFLNHITVKRKILQEAANQEEKEEEN